MVRRVKTLGVALEAVTIPGASEVNTRLNGDLLEVGLGIHGEAGVGVQRCVPCDELVGGMLERIRDYGLDGMEPVTGNAGVTSAAPATTQQPTTAITRITPTFRHGDELAVLVNNLGGTSNFEMLILADSVVRHLEGDAFVIAGYHVFTLVSL